jgi:hypothetical protein
MSCIRLGPLAAALRILPPNHALHSDAPASRGFPRSLRSLGAGERERYVPFADGARLWQD